MKANEVVTTEERAAQDALATTPQNVAGESGQKKIEMHFRYACPACTNIAFYSEEVRPFKTTVCKSCGKEIGCDYKNYIALNQDELDRVNA